MIIVILLVFGLILGSFVNALVWRFHAQDELTQAPKPEKTPKKAAVTTHKAPGTSISGNQQQLTAADLSMVTGHSMCSKCHHPLAPKDLVPLFSWLFLRGKCRYCHQPIEDSPLIEVLLPLLFVLSYLAWPRPLSGENLWLLGFWLVFLVGFMALAVYDLRWFLLPDRIVFPLIGLALVQLAVRAFVYHGGTAELLDAFWGVVIASGLFWLLFLVSKGQWIGGGDVTLGIVIGILVGGPLKAMLVLFIASTVGTLVAIPLMIVGKAKRTTQLPFGPYLLLATLVIVLYGDQLINSYNRLFGLN